MPDSAIATAYIAEYAPKNRRGSLAMLQQWTITVGILISYLASRRRSEACPSWPWCCSARRWQVRAARPDGPPAGQTGAVMKTTTIGGTTMLTNGQGFTLYWFAPIPRPGRPATGPAAVLAAGDRAGGRARRHRAVGRDHPVRRLDQANCGRHPLYTYVADTGPGKPMATTST